MVAVDGAGLPGAPLPFPEVKGIDVDALLDHAGSSAVYAGFERGPSRDVALTVDDLPLEPADRDRWRDTGARLAALPGHDHLVPVHSAGVLADGRPYVVTPRLPGASLGDRLAQDGPLPLAAVLDAGLQLVRGLAHLHAAGLAHGNVSPTTALLLDDARVALAAPVRPAPDDPALAVAEDVRGVGATLYALLSGSAGSPDATGPPPSLSAELPDVPRPVVGLLERTLDADPAARPASVADLEAELAACAPLADYAERRRWADRYRTVAATTPVRASAASRAPRPPVDTLIPAGPPVEALIPAGRPVEALLPAGPPVEVAIDPAPATAEPSSARRRRAGAIAVVLALVALAVGIPLLVWRSGAATSLSLVRATPAAGTVAAAATSAPATPSDGAASVGGTASAEASAQVSSSATSDPDPSEASTSEPSEAVIASATAATAIPGDTASAKGVAGTLCLTAAPSAVPDGAIVVAGDLISQTWQVRNCGTEIWQGNGWRLVRISGTIEPVTLPVSVGAGVVPGQTILEATQFFAPKATGPASGVYQLVAPDGRIAVGMLRFSVVVASAPGQAT